MNLNSAGGNIKLRNLLRFRSANNPDDVLEQAVGKFSHVVIIGVSSLDESLDVRASTNVSNAEANLMVDKFKQIILEQEDE